MAKQPLQQRLRDYHVYDQSLRILGSHPIVSRGEARIAVLTKAQAQYWLDQGIIGEQPFAELNDNHRDLLHQFTKGRVAKDGSEVEPKPALPVGEEPHESGNFATLGENEPVGH